MEMVKANLSMGKVEFKEKVKEINERFNSIENKIQEQN